MSKGRLEVFSDGVFAIAITLLVLDLRVPDPRAGREAGGRHLQRCHAGMGLANSFIWLHITGERGRLHEHLDRGAHRASLHTR